jgi:hypothetical protein
MFQKNIEEYISVNYGRPNPKKTFINKVFNNKTNTAVEVTFGYENKMPDSDAYFGVCSY